jgi:putative membrane protein
MKTLLIVVFLVIFVIALIFSVLNFHSVEINLWFTTISLPLTVALTIELFAGIGIGLLAAFFHILRLKAEYAQLNKKYNKINQ